MDHHIRRFAHRRHGAGDEGATIGIADLETESAWFAYVKALMYRRADLA